jgi:hypothetical protein
MQGRTSSRGFLLATAVACVSAAIPLSARGDGPKGPSIVVTGCVSGGVLSGVAAADDTSGRTFAPRYRLAGSKAMVKEIKRDHSGHADEFTGIITGDDASLGVGPSVSLGKLSVRVGGNPNDPPNAARVPETPVFEVSSFRHTEVSCK